MSKPTNLDEAYERWHKRWGHKLMAPVRKKLNEALYDLCRVRHDAIPIADLDLLLVKHGLQPTEPALYCGLQGRATLEVGVDNSVLVLTWYREPSQQTFEIVAYMS